MNLDIFNKEHTVIINQAITVMRAKNADYSMNDDALAGFKKIAKDLNISPFQVWAVFASKHWQALTNFASKGTVESEPIEGRIIDMINYSCLLYLLIRDSESWTNTIITDYPILEKDSINPNNPILDSNPKSFR